MAPEKVRSMLEYVDRKDNERITWPEFTDWLEKEGIIRDKMHDAGLHETGKTRLIEGETFKLSKNRMEYRIEHMIPIKVTTELELLLLVFENNVA